MEDEIRELIKVLEEKQEHALKTGQDSNDEFYYGIAEGLSHAIHRLNAVLEHDSVHGGPN